jgi:hypothetical protein
MPGTIEGREACGKQERVVLEGAEERFGMRIVVAHPGAGMGWRDAGDVHEGEDAAGLQGAVVFAGQDEQRMHGQDGLAVCRIVREYAGFSVSQTSAATIFRL